MGHILMIYTPVLANKGKQYPKNIFKCCEFLQDFIFEGIYNHTPQYDKWLPGFQKSKSELLHVLFSPS